MISYRGRVRSAARTHGGPTVRFSEAGEGCVSQPTRPRERGARATGGRGRTVDGYTHVVVCHRNLSGRPSESRSNRQKRTTAARGPDRRRGARAEAARGLAKVSGIRPSDRRGPGPAGHRGRNVRSTGRCSYNLRITRRRADSCGLHRSTSQVIRRSGSGV